MFTAIDPAFHFLRFVSLPFYFSFDISLTFPFRVIAFDDAAPEHRSIQFEFRYSELVASIPVDNQLLVSLLLFNYFFPSFLNLYFLLSHVFSFEYTL